MSQCSDGTLKFYWANTDPFQVDVLSTPLKRVLDPQKGPTPAKKPGLRISKGSGPSQPLPRLGPQTAPVSALHYAPVEKKAFRLDELRN